MTAKAKYYDCAIIGGGPGGLVSALYLRRFRRRCILFNSGRPRVSWGPSIRNLIGYYEGIPGRILLNRLNRQLDEVGGLDRCESQARVTRLNPGFQIETSSGQSVRAKTVVLATGIEDVHPEIENLVQLREAGLLKYCSICDGFEMRERAIAVLAKDDYGIQKAMFLENWTRNIKIIIPTDMKLAPQRIREIRKTRAILLRCASIKMEIAGNNEGLWIQVNQKRPFLCSVAYVELGCRVNNEAFASLKKLRKTREGYLVTTTEQRTSIPGLFAVGDCVNLLGQISVASGQAAVAATTIHNDLLEI
ncbi:MAG: NAD(P)/FAD-dependent oxidoreductase [Bdellovibrionia bacterium]